MKKMQKLCKAIVAAMAVFVLLTVSTACNRYNTPSLDPDNPVLITIWHYYNGAVLNSFENMVREFNDSVGMERGIIVEAIGMGNIRELETAVFASMRGEAGSMELPNIFAAFPAVAYEAQSLGLLANLDEYFTAEQQAYYFAPFLERGRIGNNGELRIFPVSKNQRSITSEQNMQV